MLHCRRVKLKERDLILVELGKRVVAMVSHREGGIKWRRSEWLLGS